MSARHDRWYVGVDEREALARAKLENPDGFEIVSMRKTGVLWWRNTVLVVRPLVSSAQLEMSKLRLISAICAQRERRELQAAQQDVFNHAQESKR